MPSSILVPLDGSPFSERALPLAVAILRKTGGVLHLAHVHASPLPPSYFGELAVYDTHWEEQLRMDERELLRQAAAQVRGTAGVSVVTALLEGEVVPGLAAYAERHDIDLIVMSTHGRGGISRAWLGSSADGLMRETVRPLLLIRPPADDAPDTPANADFRHVLIPLDGSEISETILEPALELGRLTGAHFTLLRVSTPVYLVGRPFTAPSSAQVDGEGMDRKAAQSKEYLDEVASSLRERGVEVDTALVTGDLAATAILDFARHADVDLIAMATNARSGWGRLVLGSVADKVVRGAQLPVLVQRPVRVLVERKTSPPHRASGQLGRLEPDKPGAREAGRVPG